VCICESEAQAKHMATLWGSYGYYERILDITMKNEEAL
jgi:hypothetical protein